MWQKNCQMWYSNYTMWGCNRQMWEKSKGTTQREKRTITCNVGTAQYENEIVKCEKQIREPHNVTKELTYVKIKPSNVRKK